MSVEFDEQYTLSTASAIRHEEAHHSALVRFMMRIHLASNSSQAYTSLIAIAIFIFFIAIFLFIFITMGQLNKKSSIKERYGGRVVQPVVPGNQ